MREVRITHIANVLFVLTAASHAGIVWFPGEDIEIPTNPSGVVVNLQTTASTLGDDSPGAEANFFLGGFGIGNDADSTATVPTFQPVRIGTGFIDSVANLPLGATVGAASSYASGFGGSGSHIPAEFTAGTPGYLGFSLETGSGLVYG